jgi:transcriptional regulator with AAA-type ATPase domain
MARVHSGVVRDAFRSDFQLTRPRKITDRQIEPKLLVQCGALRDVYRNAALQVRHCGVGLQRHSRASACSTGFYRLNVFPIEIPPLRERREDIPLLVEYFIAHFARKAGKSFRGINKKTLDLLLSYPWPGNIRELQNVVERSVIVCEPENFSVDESWLSRRSVASEPKSQLELSQKLAAQEKELIEAALRKSGGRVSGPSGAAAKLGIHRSTLESKITSLKIDKHRFKTAGASNNS